MFFYPSLGERERTEAEQTEVPAHGLVAVVRFCAAVYSVVVSYIPYRVMLDIRAIGTFLPAAKPSWMSNESASACPWRGK